MWRLSRYERVMGNWSLQGGCKLGNTQNDVGELIRWKAWQMRSLYLAAGGFLIAVGAGATGIVLTIVLLSASFVDMTVVMVGFAAGLILIGGMAYGIIRIGYNVRKSRILGSRREAVIDHLIGRVQDKDYGPYEAVIQLIGDIGNSRATASVVEALEDEDEEVRRRSAETLGKIGDWQAVEPLVMALKDKAWGD